MAQKRKIIKQFIYNVLGTILPTLALQLFILPLIAKRMDGDSYGFVLAIVASVMMISSGIGNVLNNIQMLSNSEYEAKKERGDFGVLFVANACIISFVTVGIVWYYEIKNIETYFLIFLMSLVVYAKDYYIVRFWIDLDYRRILICNTLCVIGYILGYGIFYLGGAWQFIYIIGNVFSLFYIVWKYPIEISIFSKTALFMPTTKKFCALAVATLLSRSLQYIDRLLLYPLMGGEEVTIYYVATLIGKTISMALAPLNSFLLSQIAKRKEMSRTIFGKILLVSFGMGIIGYLVCIIAAKPLLGLLYPQWIEKSMKYIYVTTIAAIFSAISLVLNPIILRFCNMNWQMFINGVCFAIYITISLVLLKRFGLMGFCIGNMLANGIVLFLKVIVYVYTNKGEASKSCAESVDI